MAEPQEAAQPWEKLRARAADPNASAFVSPTGEIEIYPKGGIDGAQEEMLAKRGLRTASPEDIEKRAQHLRYSTVGEQAHAAVDLAANTATFGLINTKELDPGAVQRREALEKESPGLALGARIAGGLAPTLLTGGVAGAAGLGRLGVGVAEGLGAGIADESAQAAWEGRELSAGNVALAGLGGALFAGAIPAVLRRGSRLIGKADDAVAAAAGEVGENVGPRLEAAANARAARAVDGMAPGPARDAVLRQAAPKHLERIRAEVTDVATRASEAMGKADLDAKTLKRLMPKDAPVQTEWATRTAEELRKAAAGTTTAGKVVTDSVASTSDELAAMLGTKTVARQVATPHPQADLLRRTADSLLESKGGLDTLQRARSAMAELRKAGADEAAESLRKGITDQSLFGRAAEAVDDFERGAAKAPRSPLEGFDPENLTEASRRELTTLAESLEDRAAARAKWDVGGGKDAQAKRLLSDAQRIRKSLALADDVAGARSREAAADAASTAAAEPAKGLAGAFQEATRGFAGDLASEGVEYIAEKALGGLIPGAGLAIRIGRRMWSAIDATGRESIRQAARGAARGAMRAAEVGAEGVRRAIPALEQFRGDYPGPQEAFTARRDMLLQMSQDPTVLPNALAESFGDLPRQDPQLFQAIATRMAKGVAYVTANLPAGVATSMTHPRGVKPSRDTLRDFAVVWNSAMHPETVIDAVENGTASPEQIRALKTVDADSYANLLQDITAEIGQNYEQTPSQTKQWLDILFGSDGIAGPAYSWAAADYAAEARAKKGSGGMPMGALPPPSEQAPQASGIKAIQAGVTNRTGAT